MNRLLFWSLLSITFIYAQNVQYYYYYPYPQNQRQLYYPVRTNCQNRCIPQVRYRWTYRPMTMNGRGPYRPSIGNEIKAIPDPKPIVPNYKPKTTSLPIYITTTPSTTAQPTSTTTELPTPPPYTGPYPPNVDSTSNFMRPSKKPETTTADNIKYGRSNPCPDGRPLSNEFDSPMTCNFVVRPNGGCPEDYWCHTGSSYATTACCPIIKWEDKCLMDRSNGEGEDLIPRWYYDATSGECKRFLYKGLRGNQNNFITSVQCLESCGGSTIRSNALLNPCSIGVPARGADSAIITCTNKDEAVCPSGFYCLMSSDKAGTCCERTSKEDRCKLPLSLGEGPSRLKRFYYNSIAKRCIEFVYGGQRGNENNFLDYQECKRQCMVFENPCPGTPTNIERKECSVNGLCEKGEWCHVGKETTACCPGAVSNPCKLTLEFGEGNENLTRWYSDPSDKSCNSNCKPFQYRGSKGNQNNFLSKESCETMCKVECTNPCSSDLLISPISGRPRQCGPTSPCPNSFYCHVGLTPETTVCCAAIKNPCDLPMVEGFGSGSMTRYYFNKRDRQCLSFIYRGIGGNQNNFLTVAECQSSCPAYDNPCGSGQPLLVDHKPKICSPSQRCPGTHYCHIGLEGTANVCCPKNGDPCELPVSSGTGSGALKRFYYDKDTKRCREFIYYGAGGNSNSFLSIDDCELICQVPTNPCKNGDPLFDKETREPVVCGGPQECPSGYFCHIGASPQTTNCCPGTKRPCELEVENGDGGLELDRWYFDAGAQVCRPFKYGGLMGNANSFLSVQDCEKTCLAHQIHAYCPHGIPQLDHITKKPVPCGILKSCQIGFVCHVSIDYKVSVCCENPAKFCLESRESGNCTGSEIRYGYNSLTDTCVEYKYTGCGGTLNNFKSLEKCTQICCKEY